MNIMRMECDYLEGAHEQVLNALCRTNGRGVSRRGLRRGPVGRRCCLFVLALCVFSSWERNIPPFALRPPGGLRLGIDLEFGHLSPSRFRYVSVVARCS